MNNILQMLMRVNNPQQLAISLLKQNAGNNPMANNLIQMIQNGDSNGIRDLAKNLCREKGINPDQALNELMQMYRR